MVDTEKKAIKEYIASINSHFTSGVATEHSYRPDLENLLKALLPKFSIINEPRRIACGAPDLMIAKKLGNVDVPVTFLEAKDIGNPDLDGNNQNKEQFKRYRDSLSKVIFTDYLDFHFYENGLFVEAIRVGEIKGNKIILRESELDSFTELFKHFAEGTPQKINSSAKLAQMMANKARLLKAAVEKDLESDTEKTGDLAGQHNAFKKILIHDLNEKQFADIYAQTICYGMFAARFHDTTPEDFSREEAANLIPKTNPFLRKIFQNIATFDINDSIIWILDDLVEMFRLTDLHEVMKNFGKSTAQTDPVIHFYEDFLKYYDPKLKKACGVYYTPEPVVKFIVNAVDEILQKDFNMSDGIADTTKVQLDRIVDGSFNKKGKDHKVHEMREYHKVQILDPATGTGTFLAEIIQKIHSKMEGQQGAWQSYVEDHLLPRLNGFEFMMAPYSVAHLKMDLVLSETGYKAENDKRFRIFLTNSLEECDPNTGTLFAQWLAQEANEANYIKRDTPVMVMIGNPPYSGESSNKGEWILDLMKDYKKEPGGIENLKERNSKWINDDYCKFIRLGQYYVDKNGYGILAFINNNSFLDNPTFRGMRWSLMQSFDDIYILDLHGNSKKKEVCKDGSKDENVFDIMQGVSINIFVKKKNNNSTRHSEQNVSNPSCHSERSEESSNLANVYHFELFGKREDKYEFLKKHTINDIPWTKSNSQDPYFFFIPKTNNGKDEYENFFPINNLLKTNSMGVTSGKDSIFINSNISALIRSAESQVQNVNKTLIKRYLYRPFDKQHIYYDPQKIARARESFMRNFIENENLGFCLIKINSRDEGCTVFITNEITDKTILSSKDNANVFPLYLYPTDEEAALGETRKPNLDEEIWQKIDKCIQIPDQVGNDDSQEHITTPEQIFDYIYGVLHTPSYREKYKEFLKVDFPRIPYPENVDKFNQIVALGNKLRQLHLMEEIPQSTVAFNIPGDNLISEIKYQDSRIYINKTQYFDNVPELAWNFYIGGYQPAQKWLKDRKGRTLSFDDIAHYRKIIAILIETDHLMKELDSISQDGSNVHV